MTSKIRLFIPRALAHQLAYGRSVYYCPVVLPRLYHITVSIPPPLNSLFSFPFQGLALAGIEPVTWKSAFVYRFLLYQLSYKAVSPPARNRRQADSQKERGMVVWPSPASNRKSRLDGEGHVGRKKSTPR